MAATESVTPEPHRRLIRLPRPLWIALATAVVGLAAVGLRFGLPVYRQRAAIRAIEATGGIVLTKGGGPNWLRRWVGDERMWAFDKVYSVDLPEPASTDDVIRHLISFAELEELRVSSGGITDKSIEKLRRLPRLKKLRVTGLTDAGIERIARLKQLKDLTIIGSGVTDTGIMYLRPLTELNALTLYGTRATYTSLTELKRELPNLKFERDPGIAPAL